MSAARLVLVLGGAATLACCSFFAPYPTYPTAPAIADTGPRVAICYNPLHSNREKVRADAQAECSPGTVAEPVETDWKLDFCPLLLPSRASFVCAKR